MDPQCGTVCRLLCLTEHVRTASEEESSFQTVVNISTCTSTGAVVASCDCDSVAAYIGGLNVILTKGI